MHTPLTSTPLGDTLAALMAPLVPHEGSVTTALPRVSLFSIRCHLPRTPLIYEPSLIIIAKGRKVGYLGQREIHYDPDHYLVQTLPLPFECESFGTPEIPLLGIAITFDPALLRELVMAIAYDDAQSEPLRPMDSVAMTSAMHEAVTRLLSTLHDPVACRAMGDARIREVMFEALKGEQQSALRAMVQGQGHYARIVQVVSQLHTEYAQEMSVEALATRAHMSPSAFHQHFKRITHASPVQYLKRLRLIKAQQLLQQPDVNVGLAAQQVGYRSAAQFSRDYKRYFGVTPLKHRRDERALETL